MAEKIIYTVLAFILFIFIFYFKLIKKNDTTYISILILQAIGILFNFVQILFSVCTGLGFYFLIYAFSIVTPILVFTLEYNGINISEKISIMRAYIYKLLKNNKKYKQVLLEITDKYDNSYMAHKLLAEIYQQEGGMRKAIDEYVKVLDINSKDSKTYYEISKLLYQLDKKDEAIQMLKNLLKVRQENYDSMHLLGQILLENKDYKGAIDVYTKAVGKYPEDETIFNNLGIAYTMINDFSLAKASYLKVIEINNENFVAYYRLAQISLLYREFDSAAEYFKKSLCEENEAKVYFELAKIYIMKNDRSKANFVLLKAIEKDSRLYNKMLEEPVLYALRNNIKKPLKDDYNDYEQKENEKIVEEYLNDTYNLTKILDQQDNKKRK